MKTTVLREGVNYSFIKTERFKTTVISVGFYLPLGNLNAATSLASALMKSGTKALPDLYSFNRKLASLYGAGVSSWTAKQGDTKEIRINITVNDDRYSLFGENTVDEAGALFCDMIFSRFKDGSVYPDFAVDREKRLLSEKIASKLNDKRTYARNRLEELMCEGEPFGNSPDGTKNEAEQLSATDAAAAFCELIETSFISVLVIGDKEPLGFADTFSTEISNINRRYTPFKSDICKTARDNVLSVDEEMPVKQGKLVLGLRSENGGSDRDTLGVRVMTDIFGGGPYSKLFCNVREKMSLCYYCSARAIRSKGLIIIDSGVEEANMASAMTAILEQFEEMKNGNFTETEFKSSKLALCDMINSAESDQATLVRWYAARAMEQNPLSPADTCSLIESITREEIIEAAKGFNLDTVYRLMPDGSVKEDAQ